MRYQSVTNSNQSVANSDSTRYQSVTNSDFTCYQSVTNSDSMRYQSVTNSNLSVANSDFMRYQSIQKIINFFLFIGPLLFWSNKHEMVQFVCAAGPALNQHCFNSKHDASTQCFNVGPPSSTLAQHWNSIGWMPRVYWVIEYLPQMCTSQYSRTLDGSLV